MCQLLGMNANKPASLRFSLAGFIARGGLTDKHRDGWGFAYFDADRCRVVHDCRASAESPLARHLQRYPVRSRNIVAHIRKATQGRVALENCHPFVRTLWGRTWAFAHNGDLKGFRACFNGHYAPVGETDSERAFCYLMQSLAERFGPRPPEPQPFLAALAELAEALARFGPFNFLLSDGAVLYAHCSTELHWVERAYPFPVVSAIDSGEALELGRLNHLDDRMAVISTRPLTAGEHWHAFSSGELRMFSQGAVGVPDSRQPVLALAV